jgi:hypothetical protein
VRVVPLPEEVGRVRFPSLVELALFNLSAASLECEVRDELFPEEDFDPPKRASKSAPLPGLPLLAGGGSEVRPDPLPEPVERGEGAGAGADAGGLDGGGEGAGVDWRGGGDDVDAGGGLGCEGRVRSF